MKFCLIKSKEKRVSDEKKREDVEIHNYGPFMKL